MPDIKIMNPESLGRPLGQYSQISRVKASELLFIAGQLATDSSGKPVAANDFDGQCRQVFANIEAGLKSQGASFANVVEFTTYLVHSQDIARFMASSRACSRAAFIRPTRCSSSIAWCRNPS